MRRSLPLVLLGASLACFSGEGTLGGACEGDGDCGDEQTCERSICSLCGDGVAQSGELCLAGPEATDAVSHGVSSFAPIDMNGDGLADLVWPAETGLAVALVSAEGLGAPTVLTVDVTGVWSGDFDGDGVTELLTRDATTGASLWRASASGELVLVTGVDLESLRGFTGAVLQPAFGIVARAGQRLVRVDAQGQPSALELDDAVTHLVAVPSLDAGGEADVVAVTGLRTLVAAAATDDGLDPLPGHAFSDDILEPDILDIAPVSWNGDVVVLFDGGEVQVWLSDGLGGFVMGPTRGMSPSATRVLALDVTGDRLHDVLTHGPQSDLRLAVHRDAELDTATALDDGSWLWVAPMNVGLDPFRDLVLYDGGAVSVLRGDP